MKELILKQARETLDIEAQAILHLKNQINDEFLKAVDLLFGCSGKVVLTGMGKSGQIARKIASTLSSTGTPAVFLHPAEGSHGDLGIVMQSDVVIALSYGGETPELAGVLAYAGRKSIPVIAMTGSLSSTLAHSAQVVLNVHVEKEACPLNLAPTASSTATLALGDALAMAVLVRRGFSPQDFAQFHPGGSLGRRLLTRIRDLMHGGESTPLVKEDAPMRDILSIMTSKDVRGAAGVVNPKGELIGVITDGDLRRRLEKNINPLNDRAMDIMNQNPRMMLADELAEKALALMEEHKIQFVFVAEKIGDKKPIGILHIQDLLAAKVR